MTHTDKKTILSNLKSSWGMNHSLKSNKISPYDSYKKYIFKFARYNLNYYPVLADSNLRNVLYHGMTRIWLLAATPVASRADKQSSSIIKN